MEPDGQAVTGDAPPTQSDTRTTGGDSQSIEPPDTEPNMAGIGGT